jgi:DDB1- and CUL4-associated factor 11
MQLLIYLSIAARAGQWTERELLLFLQLPDLDDVIASLLRPDGEQVVTREFNRRLRQAEPKDPNRFPKVPSDEGTRLMYTGAFGANNHERYPNKHLARRLLERELGLGSWQERKLNNDLLTQSLIPNTPADQIIHYSEPVYSGQFSDDGNFFYSCCQDFKVRLYDTSNPYNWKHYKTVAYPWGQWTLTDASLSPDNKWLAYTSHSNLVSIAPTDPRDEGDPYSLDLGDTTGLGQAGSGRGFSSIFSIRFSGNGRELVAGTNRDSLVVYDIESRRVLLNVRGHEDDVNAVCFADKQSPHIIYSGSDDTTIKVWDRRSMRHEREVGAFVGHIEGLTYIDSKGDGRYVLSNGKDQSMKLWDIRMAMSTSTFRELQPMRHVQRRRFDYRMSRYNEDNWEPHPDDNSVVTFRGHKVLYTLIRCHFSPPSATNSRYVYSGSQDGKVHIWNMDATKAGEIDVREATRGTLPRDNRQRFYSRMSGGDWNTCVRDASWHPNAPFIAGKNCLVL